ncbi:MAG: hypothetical protein WC822_07065 [Candidatus Paceibacterota bacterium]|jgi:hypothetical protein
MSHKGNEEWLENAHQNFQDAIDEGSYALAKAVIADVQERGFTDAGRAMNEVLRNTPLENFHRETQEI